MRICGSRKEEEGGEIHALEEFMILILHLTDFILLRFQTGIHLNENSTIYTGKCEGHAAFERKTST